MKELLQEEVDEMLLKYGFAKKKLETGLDILIQAHAYRLGYNSVEHVKSRIKSMESTATKLKEKGLDLTVINITRYIYDMVGIRIVCSFVSDVYEIAKVIRESNEFMIKKELDYIKNPKESGYRSYHMHVLVPINLDDKTEYVQAEIQIRTVAMDCWASLDHKLRYKLPKKVELAVKKEISECASDMMKVDIKMQKLSNIVNEMI